jgi:hypothetical protein
VHCEKMVSVTNCDYSEINGLVQKILILTSILGILPNSCLELKKSFSHMPKKNHITTTGTTGIS